MARRLAQASVGGVPCSTRPRSSGAGLQHQRRHHRHLGRGEFEREGVFLDDLRVAPAARAVELGDHRTAVFQEDLEDAVFVGVELQDAAVAAQAHGCPARRAPVRVEVAEVHAVRRSRSAVAIQWRSEPVGGSITRPPTSSGAIGSSRTLRPLRSEPKSLISPLSARPSTPKNESWKKPESCHSVVRSRRLLGHGAGQVVARLAHRGAGLRPARRRADLRHQQLQFGNRGQVVERAAQVTHAAGAEHRLLDLDTASRVAAFGVQVDGRQHAPVGAADRKADVGGAQQVVPVAHLARVGGLAKAHQRQLGQQHMVRQRFAQLAIDAPLVGAEHRARGQGPLRRQRRLLGHALARRRQQHRPQQQGQRQ